MTMLQHSFPSILSALVSQFPFGFQVCKIVSGQQYRKKLDSQQVSKLMDSTCQRPSDRENNIRQVLAISAFFILFYLI